MTTPVRTQVRKRLEPMRYPMIELFLIGVGLSIGLADAFGNDFGEALRVASILAILALHSRRVLQKLATKSTSHDAVELLFDEPVAVLFLHLLFALSDGTFTTESNIEAGFASILFGYGGQLSQKAKVGALLTEAHGKFNTADRLEGKPGVDNIRIALFTLPLPLTATHHAGRSHTTQLHIWVEAMRWLGWPIPTSWITVQLICCHPLRSAKLSFDLFPSHFFH